MSEDKNFKSALEKAEELENMNFSDNNDFNVSDYYSALEKIAEKNNNLKHEEAENIVNDKAKDMIDDEFVAELDTKRQTVINFLKKYDPNKKETQDLELQDVDKVYAISNYLLNSYIQYVNDMKFVFELTKLEFKFLNKILTSEIEYDGDEVFNYVEFYDSFWVHVKNKFEEEDKNAEKHTFKVSIKTLLILHHLIKGYKVKGRTVDFKNFRNILFRIAQINKLFNAYNIIIERIKKDRELWGNALDEITKTKDPEYIKYQQQLEEENKKKQGLKNVEVHEVTDADFGK